MRPPHSRFKSQAEKIAWITLFWIVISIFQFFTGYSSLLQLNCDLDGLKASAFFTGSIITGLSAGLLGGTLLVFYWNSWLRTMAYGRSLINILWTYTLVYLIVSLISSLFYNTTILNFTPFQSELWQLVWMDITSLIQIQNYLFWFGVVILTLIALLVNDKYGPRIFISFLLGKYFHPKREERVFMFLDLRGSTSIAEQLGEDQYFLFLKDAYKDATPAILNSKGEIYQYVGDEVVVSWKKEFGIENANSLQCFFDIQKCFLKRASYYREKYKGIVPEFKAGLHYGFVMAGEIGIVKRDIVYSGDVLNTTSRIQDKCNELDVNILISEYLMNTLKLLPKMFKPIKVGKIPLRGKQQPLMLYTV
jgi:adenylate cyclase